MNRKRGEKKEKSRKTKVSVSEDSWRTEIEDLSLNDEGWSCVIAMIVETSLDQVRYLESFGEASDEGRRESIFSLSYEKLILGVKAFGKSSANQGICNFANKKIDAEGEASLDPWLVCGLVKFFINRAKIRNLEILRSRARIEGEITKEIETLGAAARPNTNAKSKGGSGDAKLFQKVNTRLRKRGEEWRDAVRIDDAPFQGPNMYVVLTGFRRVDFATEFLGAGLPLTAIFRVLGPPENPDAQHPQGSCFWSSLETALKDPQIASGYSQVVLQTFCPPEMKEWKPEAMKIDAYRRISFLMYDLWDLRRQHSTYIGAMRLQDGLEERKPEFQTTGTYDTIMSVFPEECTSVAMILDALLSQIDGTIIPEAPDGGKKSSVTMGEMLGMKIDDFNEEFDVFYVCGAQIDPGDSDPRLILEGDDFGARTHHCSLGSCPKDLGLRVLREFGISLIWRNVEAPTNDRMEMYEYHIGQVSDCLDVNMDKLSTEHYLHLLLFDKLINAESKGEGENFHEREDLERKISLPYSPEELRLKLNVRRTKSQTITPDKSCTVESLPTSSKSDSLIEYGKKISETFQCPELFSLIDAREILGSGYLPGAETPSVKDPGIPDIQEFDTVQLLSSDVFPQVFFTCLKEFDNFETRYFAPTDSVLIFFRDNRTGNRISQEEYTASIRTPVCLRDFSRFVIFEEKDWLEKEEEKRGIRSAEEEARIRGETQTMKDGDDSALGSLYTDADFILPDSIKGRQVRKPNSGQGLADGTDAESPVRAKKGGTMRREAKETNPGKAKIRKKKDRVINAAQERGGRPEAEGFVPVSPVEKTASDHAEPIFLGYDIADHRVQVSGSTSEFLSDDGTVVRVNLEEWTYGERRLQITVELLKNSLVLHSAGDAESPRFLLTTVNGILIGFSFPFERKDEASPEPEGQSITKRNYQGGKTGGESDTARGTSASASRPEIAVDPGFRVSWPSGLVVETLKGVLSPLEPFYIKQSHLSKGPECYGISRERARAFLRDGTIVVFLEDDGVRLMRSNGRIVTCDGFAGDDKQPEKEKPGDSFSVKAKRKGLTSFAEDVEAFGLKDASGSSPRFTIRRSVVLEPDGRLYEILNEEEVRELGQQLVRTASDYETGEIFTRRSDGTNILIRADGSLAVSFPDGSRITTGYVIEKDPVSCGWTEEELQRFYHEDDDLGSKSSEDILEEDGFVSIFLTFCLEHSNYATVTYDRSKIDCNISMPGDVDVQISPDNLFRVDVSTETSLKVERNEISFTRRISTSSSRSVFSLENSSTPSITEKSFFETKDSFGNVFRVDLDGGTSYEKFDGGSNPAKEDEGKDSSSSRLASQSNQKGHRLFVVKRDLSAYEYLHHSARRAQEDDQKASVFFHQVNEEPERTLCTTLTTLNPATASKAWLQSYKVKSIRPRNEDRRDLLRSTYSVPWNCLIPFGRNGPGIRNRTWNLALKSSPDSFHPEVLVARTTWRIKSPGENLLKKLQEGLARYWKRAINNFGGSRRSASPKKRGVEDWPKDFTPGGKRTFDKASYFDGLLKRRATEGLESQISRRTSGSEDKEDREEIEWYKTCLRDHTVPPYFDYVPGACFTWVLECVNKIGETSETKEEEEEEVEEEEEANETKG